MVIVESCELSVRLSTQQIDCYSGWYSNSILFYVLSRYIYAHMAAALN